MKNRAKKFVKRVRPTANPLRIDPTRTSTLRRQITAEMRRRFNRLKVALYNLIVVEDAFGLVPDTHDPFRADAARAQERVRGPKTMPEQDRKWMRGQAPEVVFNAFCPTGPGGGTDNTCSPRSDAAKLAKVGYAEIGTATTKGGEQVRFLQGSKERQLDDTFVVIKDDKEIGRAVLSGKGNYLTKVRIDDEHQRQGIGAQLYDAIEHVIGKKLVPSPLSLSPQAEGLWAKRGTANVVTNARWKFQSSAEQVKAFQAWLRSQVSSLIKVPDDKLWDMYAAAGFRKGAGRAFDDVRRVPAGRQTLDFYRGTREEFLRSSFGRPESVEKIKLLAGRSFDDLDGVTSQMSTAMSRTLTDGLVRGMNPNDIARELDQNLDLGRSRAETIARTEIIRAHAEGQLTAMKELGVEEVGVAVEWSTAGDDRVCKLCEPLEGMILKLDEAAGMIPRHPNCLLPGNIVQGSFTGGLKSRYSGKAVEIVTTLDTCRASLTVNHPVFTINGLVPAGEIKEGDYLLCHVADGQPFGDANVKHSPSLVEEVFEAFKPWSSVEVPSSFDLDGDEKFFVGEVDVVSTNLSLSKEMPGGFQRPGYFDLVPSDSGCVRCSNLLESLLVSHHRPFYNLGLALIAEGNAGLEEAFVNDTARNTETIGQRFRRLTCQVALLDNLVVQFKAMPNERSLRLCPKSNTKPGKAIAEGIPADADIRTKRLQRLSGEVSNRQSTVVDPASISDGLCIGLASELDVPFHKSIPQNPESYASFVSQLTQRFPSKIALRKVVEVRHFSYSGFVYDLETLPGYFSTNQGGNESIIIKNCRCAWIPANVGEPKETELDSKGAIDAAVRVSVAREGDDNEDGGAWGPSGEVSRDRPESRLNSADAALLEFSRYAANAFCATGPGGGIDNTCGADDEGGAEDDAESALDDERDAEDDERSAQYDEEYAALVEERRAEDAAITARREAEDAADDAAEERARSRSAEDADREERRERESSARAERHAAEVKVYEAKSLEAYEQLTARHETEKAALAEKHEKEDDEFDGTTREAGKKDARQVREYDALESRHEKELDAFTDEEDRGLAAIEKKHAREDADAEKGERAEDRALALERKREDRELGVPLDADQFRARVAARAAEDAKIAKDRQRRDERDRAEVEERERGVAAARAKQDAERAKVRNSTEDPLYAFSRYVTHAFCPTGPGGGQDNSCSPNAGASSVVSEKAVQLAKEWLTKKHPATQQKIRQQLLKELGDDPTGDKWAAAIRATRGIKSEPSAITSSVSASAPIVDIPTPIPAVDTSTPPSAAHLATDAPQTTRVEGERNYKEITDPKTATEFTAPLSSSERAALERYKGAGYRYVNAVAMGEGEKLGRLQRLEGEKNFPLVESAMAKSRTTEDVIVHRGIPAFVSQVASLSSGDEFKLPLYTSTSASEAKAREFLDRTGGTMMRIKVPKGTNALAADQFGQVNKKERELILDRGLSYRVLSKEIRGNVNYLDVEVMARGVIGNARWEFLSVANGFCPTGVGGGLDNSCGRNSTKSELMSKHVNDSKSLTDDEKTRLLEEIHDSKTQKAVLYVQGVSG